MSRSAAELARDLQAETAIRRVLAVEMAAAATFWKSVFDGAWLRHFSISGTVHGLVVVTSAACAGWLLGPIAARARDAGRAAGRAITMSVVGGVIVAVTTMPLANVGLIRSANSHFLADAAFKGAALGFFAGLAACPIVVHQVAIRCLRSLDGAPRLYLAASAALIVLATTLIVFINRITVAWGGIFGASLLAAAAGFGALAIHSGRSSGTAGGERMAADLHAPPSEQKPRVLRAVCAGVLGGVLLVVAFVSPVILAALALGG